LVRLIGRFFVFTKSEPNDDPVCPNNLQKLWYVIEKAEDAGEVCRQYPLFFISTSQRMQIKRMPLWLCYSEIAETAVSPEPL
jgi:hypothetical protein